ncbi:hypothetical protein Tco_1398458, partial [Tanacetum coccineum]
MSTPVFAYLVETETPRSPHIVASPTLLPDSTPPTRHAEDSVDSDTSGARSTPSDSTAPLSPDHPLAHASPTLVPILRRTTRMAVRVLPAISPGLSSSIAETFLHRSVIGESSDSDSKSEGVKDEGPTVEDEDPAAWDEGLAAEDEGPSMRVESLGLGGDATVPEGQQWATPVVETAVGEPLGLGYEALRRQEIALGEGRMPSVFKVGQSSRSVPEPERPERVSALRQPTLTTWIDLEDGIAYIDVTAYPLPAPPVQTPPSPEWSSSSLPVSPTPSIVPSHISSPMVPLTVPSPIASPVTAETEGFLTELGGRVEMQGGLIRGH